MHIFQHVKKNVLHPEADLHWQTPCQMLVCIVPSKKNDKTKYNAINTHGLFAFSVFHYLQRGDSQKDPTADRTLSLSRRPLCQIKQWILAVSWLGGWQHYKYDPWPIIDHDPLWVHGPLGSCHNKLSLMATVALCAMLAVFCSETKKKRKKNTMVVLFLGLVKSLTVCSS